jgi:hypothetical protein
MNIQHGDMEKKHGHCSMGSINMPHEHICSLDMQHGDMDLQTGHGHAALLIFSCFIVVEASAGLSILTLISRCFSTIDAPRLLMLMTYQWIHLK